jgi:glucose/arabinose dehydrogenase
MRLQGRHVITWLAGAGVIATLVLAASTASAQDPLLSRNKPTLASSSGGCCPPPSAVDGNSGTRWASGAGSDPQWLRVDLGATANISRVRLQWDLSCAVSYRLETSPDGSSWSQIFTTTTGDGGVDDVAVGGVGRYVRMFGTKRCRADSSHGYSLQEFDVFGNTGPVDNIPPSVPQNPRASNLTCNSVTFSWDPSSDNSGAVASYDIYHDGQFIKTVNGNTTSTSFAVLETVQWGLYVNARDGAGNLSQASDTVQITPPPCEVDNQPPTAPTNLRGTASGTSVSLQWNASSDNRQVMVYEIYRDGSLAGTVTGIVGTPPGTSFNDAGREPNTDYDYFVLAKDQQNNASPHSNTITVHTGSGCTSTVCAANQVTTDTDIPWGIVTLPDGSILFARRDAHNIMRLVPSTGAKTTVGAVPNVQSTNGEGGLMGLEINPKTFASDHWLYIMHTSSSDNRIVRVKYENNQIQSDTYQVLLTGIAKNKFHNGGRLRFSPDGKFLFASCGDGQTGTRAQQNTSLNGKILRINPDGTIPSDNPFGNAVWSKGHRNPQGLAFDSQGRLWEQEFGDSNMDETNLIVKGGNYGWPDCEGTSNHGGGGCGQSGFLAPKATYSVGSGSCSGITIIRDALYVACEKGERLNRFVISGSSLTGKQTFFQGSFGRLRTVEPAPDGGMWMSTSNGDKDSTANNSNTKIFHVGLGN